MNASSGRRRSVRGRPSGKSDKGSSRHHGRSQRASRSRRASTRGKRGTEAGEEDEGSMHSDRSRSSAETHSQSSSGDGGDYGYEGDSGEYNSADVSFKEQNGAAGGSEGDEVAGGEVQGNDEDSLGALLPSFMYMYCCVY